MGALADALPSCFCFWSTECLNHIPDIAPVPRTEMVALYKSMQALCCSVAAAVLLEHSSLPFGKAEMGLSSVKCLYSLFGVLQGLESMNFGVTEPKF